VYILLIVWTYKQHIFLLKVNQSLLYCLERDIIVARIHTPLGSGEKHKNIIRVTHIRLLLTAINYILSSSLGESNTYVISVLKLLHLTNEREFKGGRKKVTTFSPPLTHCLFTFKYKYLNVHMFLYESGTYAAMFC